MAQQKKILNDVVYIRLLLIILLVLHHAFAIYSGAWVIPNGIHEVKVYKWISLLSYSFMLETFVFVSGYVFGYQIRNKFNSHVDFNTCVIKKAKRLMVPGIIFSTIYFICFNYNSSLEFSWGVAYNIIIGEGHLWFLPMLFLCFVSIFIFEKLKLSPKTSLILAVLAALFSLGPLASLPFRISSTLYYFFYFALGYYIQKSNKRFDTIIDKRSIIFLFCGYVVAFLIYQCIFNESVFFAHLHGSFAIDILESFGRRFMKIAQALLGLFAILGLVNYLLDKKIIRITSFTIKLSSYCFGVYIFQQFILKYIVNSSTFINVFGSILLPWVAFIIALSFSLLLTNLMLRSKLGRYLIG